MSDKQPWFLSDFNDEQVCYARVADHLTAGVADPHHPFHWPAVATVDGDRPAVRTVVLRSFDTAARTATFHTDARSAKVDQLKRDPRIDLHLYDNAAQLQVIVIAAAELHHQDEVSRAEWVAASPGSRAAYGEPLPPGTVIAADDPVAATPPIENVESSAYENFVVVICKITELEVLELLPSGNRRASLTWAGGTLALNRLSP